MRRVENIKVFIVAKQILFLHISTPGKQAKSFLSDRRFMRQDNTVLELICTFAMVHPLWSQVGFRNDVGSLTHWGRVTHVCISKLTIIGSDNGSSPERRQVIIWTNDGILLIGPLGTNLSDLVTEIYIFQFQKMRSKMSSGKWRPSCLGLNVLKTAINNGEPAYICGTLLFQRLYGWGRLMLSSYITSEFDHIFLPRSSNRVSSFH